MCAALLAQFLVLLPASQAPQLALCTCASRLTSRLGARRPSTLESSRRGRRRPHSPNTPDVALPLTQIAAATESSLAPPPCALRAFDLRRLRSPFSVAPPPPLPALRARRWLTQPLRRRRARAQSPSPLGGWRQEGGGEEKARVPGTHPARTHRGDRPSPAADGRRASALLLLRGSPPQSSSPSAVRGARELSPPQS